MVAEQAEPAKSEASATKSAVEAVVEVDQTTVSTATKSNASLEDEPLVRTAEQAMKPSAVEQTLPSSPEATVAGQTPAVPPAQQPAGGNLIAEMDLRPVEPLTQDVLIVPQERYRSSVPPSTSYKTGDLANAYAPSAVSITSREAGSAETGGQRNQNSAVRAASKQQASAPVHDAKKYYQLGLAAHQSGELDQAERYYQLGLKQSPNDENLLTNLSAVYLEQGDLARAGQTLEQARRLRPRSVNVLVNLGIMELRQDHFAQAKMWFRQAIQISPNNERALTNLAYLAQNEGNIREVEDYYQRILRNKPDNVDVLLAYASLLERSERFQDAIAQYRAGMEMETVRNDSRLLGQIRNRVKLLSRYSEGSQTAGAAR